MICTEPILVFWKFMLIWDMHPRVSQPWAAFEMKPCFRWVRRLGQLPSIFWWQWGQICHCNWGFLIGSCRCGFSTRDSRIRRRRRRRRRRKNIRRRKKRRRNNPRKRKLNLHLHLHQHILPLSCQHPQKLISMTIMMPGNDRLWNLIPREEEDGKRSHKCKTCICIPQHSSRLLLLWKLSLGSHYVMTALS